MRAGDKEFKARVRIDTPKEVDYFQHGGILPFVLRGLLATAARTCPARCPSPRPCASSSPPPARPGTSRRAAAVFRDAASAFAEVTHDTVGSTVARVQRHGRRAAARRRRPHRRDRPDRPPHRRRRLPLVHRRRRLGPGDPRRPARRDRHARRRRSPAWSARSRSTCSRTRSARRRPSSRTCTSTSARRTATTRARCVRIGDVAVIAGEPRRAAQRPRRLALDGQPARLLRRARGRAAGGRGGRRARRRRARSRVAQEEITFGGARTTAYSLRPDVADRRRRDLRHRRARAPTRRSSAGTSSAPAR